MQKNARRWMKSLLGLAMAVMMTVGMMPLPVQADTSLKNNTITVISYNHTYDGAYHGITATSAVPDGTTLYYSMTGGASANDWTTTPPRWKDVAFAQDGTTVIPRTVFVKAVNPDCAATTYGQGTVTITKATATVTGDDKTRVFGTRSTGGLTSTVTGAFGNDSLKAATSDDTSQGSDNIGNHPIITKQSNEPDPSRANYDITYKDGTLTITKSKNNIVNATPYTGIYDGNPHTITASASVTSDLLNPLHPTQTVLWYSTTGGTNATWSTTAPTRTDAGTLTVYVKATNSNYEDAFGQATITILKKPITITGETGCKPYTNTAQNLNVITASGLIAGDTLTGLTYSASGTDHGTYMGNFSGTAVIKKGNTDVTGNYSIASTVQGRLVISEDKKNAVAVADYSGVYDGEAHGITAAAAQEGSTLYYSTVEPKTATEADWSPTAPAWKDVTAAQTVYVKAVCQNFAPAFGQATVTITQKEVTVKADSLTKDVNSDDPKPFPVRVIGTLGGDTVSYKYEREAGWNAVNYTITPSGEISQGNYHVTYETGILTIVPSDSQNEILSDRYATYDGTAYGLDYLPSYGQCSTDNHTWLNTVTFTNVGDHKVYVKVTDPNKYDYVTTAYVRIKPRLLNLKVESTSVPYDGNAHTLSAITAEGLLSGQSISGMTYSASGTKPGTYTGTFTGTPKVTDSTGADVTKNYFITTEPGVLTITRGSAASNPVTVTGYSGTYDGSAHSITASAPISGTTLYYSTDASDTKTWSTVRPTFTGAGNYTVYVKAVNLYYEDSFGQATVTITPAPATVTAIAASKTFGGTDPAFTASVSGLVGGESGKISYSVSRPGAGSTENAGIYAGAIVPAGDALQGNYSVTYVPGTFTINRLSAAPNVTVADQTYTGNACTPEPTVTVNSVTLVKDTDYTVSYSGNTNAGTATCLVTLTGNYSGSASKTFTIGKKQIELPFAVPNLVYSGSAQTGIAFSENDCTVTGGSAKDAGSYSAAIALKDTANTTWIGGGTEEKQVSWSISKALLTASYADERVVYGSAPTLAVNVTGFKGGETADTAANYTAPTIAAPSDKTGTYTLTPSGGEADNYDFQYVSGTLTIYVPPVAPPAPSSVEIPASSNEGSVQVKATVTGDTAAVDVTDAQIKEIAAGTETTGAVKVDTSSLDVTGATIPSKLVEAAASAAGVTGLEVVLPTGSVTLDTTALTDIAKDDAGKNDVKVEVKSVKPASLNDTQKTVLGDKADSAVIVDVNVYVNDKKVSTFSGGNVRVGIPYTPKTGENTEDLTVWYIADDGKITPMHGKYNAETKCVEFTTTHLSTYAIVRISIKRLAGDTRYDTMAEIVKQAFPDGCGTAILASGANWPDALTASSLAGAMDCPVLLTDPGQLNVTTAELLSSLGVKNVIIVGGTAAVSDAVKSAVEAKNIATERIAGNDRMQTADKIARRVIEKSSADTIIICSGQNFPDALSISSYAFAQKMPILLTGSDGKLTADSLAIAENFGKAIIVGGKGAVSLDVKTQLTTIKAVRYAGDDRYGTSAEIINNLYGGKTSMLAVATGSDYPDALVGATLAGKSGGAILLVDGQGTSLTADQKTIVGQAGSVRILGGTAAVSDAMKASVDDTLK
jgi:putative cell wall-binding protein